MNIRKLLSLAVICSVSALFVPAAPSCFAAEENSVPAKSENVWLKIFPAGITKAGKKAGTASTKNFAALKGKFVGVYFSAKWCGFCHKFTPHLQEFYKKNKAKFEVVFESQDRSEDDMIAYVKSYKMKWFAAPFGKKSNVPFLGGIPQLVVFSPDGKKFTTIGGASREKPDPRLQKLKTDMDAWFTNHADSGK